MIDNKIPQINLGATIIKYFHFPRLKTWEKEQINLGTTIIKYLLSNQTSGSS